MGRARYFKPDLRFRAPKGGLLKARSPNWGPVQGVLHRAKRSLVGLPCRICRIGLPPFERIEVFVRAKSLFASFLGSVALLASLHAFAISDDEFMNPEDAFKYTATADEQNVTIEWRATKGYYLYKKRMGLSAATPGVTVGESVYPKVEVHKDEYFGEQEVFRDTFKVTAPLSGAKVGDTVALKLKWQGCADAGLCYPPSVWDATVK